MTAWFGKGGPVMWPLLALSLVAATVVFERFLFWARERRSDPRAGVDELGREACVELAEQRLARGFAVLDTVITAAPLLGILGTVLGVIDCFEVLSASSHPDPLAISGGVAEALITTATGLTIAVAVLLPYNYLRARTRARLTEIEAALRAPAGEAA